MSYDTMPAPPAQTAVPPQTRPGAGPVTVLTISLLAATAASGYAAFTFLSRANLLGDGLPSLAEAIEADDNVATGLAAVILTQLVTGLVWLVWQFRHAKRAAALGHQHELGPGWAIGGWFVPVGNLFLPYRQLRDSASASTGGAPKVILAWWGAWLVSAVLLANSFRTQNTDLRTADQMRALSYFALALTGILAVAVVQSCTRRQREALHARGPS